MSLSPILWFLQTLTYRAVRSPQEPAGLALWFLIPPKSVSWPPGHPEQGAIGLLMQWESRGSRKHSPMPGFTTFILGQMRMIAPI